ncbi:serine/threonine protein kinase [Geodermatophilus nigrescens]|uniref:non-specific serine/threonine protein kinase n=1 Tax=Geodermatophilus nigrescens TaxID=1070870 RepID=A0A1M5JB99_9ACTN|nr:serine/threonine protein kinase [Geodermatophilus nigrescens]SHG37559.1 serine/threonine protein kinase [Geodermatophilus nigrescens]
MQQGTDAAPGGRVLGGRYTLLSLLATGGMGQVWRGRDELLRRDVAVKVLRGEFNGDPTFRARFRAEAQHAAGLVHPHIATLFDYGEGADGADGDPVAWLVMELVQGESLAGVLTRGPLDPAEAARLLRDAAAGLGAAHAAGVVHRDVKPGNVLVAADGTVKITDFGIARSAASAALTGTGQVIGTAQYMAPELVSGLPASPASDVYSLGLVGYQCLTGRLPFDGETPMQVALMQVHAQPAPLPETVPAGLRAVVERALDKDPARRFPDGGALRAALAAVPGPAAGAAALARADTAVLGGAVLGGAVLGGAVLGGAVPPPATRVLTPPAPSTPAPGTGSAPRRRRGLLLALGALLAALAVVGVVLANAGDGGDATPAAPTTTSSAPAPAPDPTVAVTAADHVGRPVGEVQQELTARGLQVTLRPVTTADVPDGQVITLDPVGALAPGTVVTVTHAVAPPPAPAPPTTAPAPEAPAEEDDEDEGNGNGNGRGNGNGNGNGRGGRGDD